MTEDATFNLLQMEEYSEREPARNFRSEDSSPTTERDLRGWYSYGLAAEVYAVCGVGSFLPVTLEQLARGRGVLLSDKTTPCIDTASGNVNIAVRRGVRALHTREDHQCIIRPFGRDTTTSSFAMYTFSLAVAIQALCFVSFSSFADHGSNRRRLLFGFGYVGATSAMAFLLVTPNTYLIASLLVIIGVTCLGSSFVLLNSYLPLLVSNYPDLGIDRARSFPSSFVDFERVQHSRSRPISASQLSTKISSRGVGIGYIAAVLVQCLSILLLFSFSKTDISSTSPSLPLRTVLFMIGLWWLVFTTLAAFWMRGRPGPPLKVDSGSRGTCLLFGHYVSFAWVSLWKTITMAIKLRHARMFLLAWFLISDAIGTVSGTAILFARTELKMGTVQIAILSITATSSGIAGAFLWPIVSKKYDLATKHTIIACMLLMEMIPVYGLLGFIPSIKAWGVGGLQQAWEIYPLGIIHGFAMGGLSSYCRSMFAFLIPPNHEAAFYALFAVTDKGSSAIGPAIVGAITDATGSIRPAFVFLAVMIVLPVPFISLVDARHGKEEAIALNQTGNAADNDVSTLEAYPTQPEQEVQALLDDNDD